MRLREKLDRSTAVASILVCHSRFAKPDLYVKVGFLLVNDWAASHPAHAGPGSVQTGSFGDCHISTKRQRPSLVENPSRKVRNEKKRILDPVVVVAKPEVRID